jgi:SAM-dependent methyltransferase
MSDNPVRRPNAPPAINRYGEMCAEVYVLDKPPGALGDSAYYLDALGRLDGPVLEAACGSGRLLIPLLEAGIDIRGFDHSESMLAQCRAACDARGLAPDLVRATFAEFAYDARFAAIICVAGAFTLIDDFDAACAALRRFHAHLAPGGRLYVDLMPLGYLTQTPADHVRSWTTPAGEVLRLDSRRTELDLLGQRRVSHDVYQRWRDGRLAEQELEILALRVWGLREFELALKDAGFPDVRVCADHRPGRAPGAGARWWCFEATRAS